MKITSILEKRGFTLVELLVVIAIVTILLSIVLFSISEARMNSRDKKRFSDLGNIEFAFTLYKEKNWRVAGTVNGYPNYPNGIELGTGLALDNSVMTAFNGNVYRDPIVDAAGSGYGYWYDSSFTCTRAGEQVIYARQLEKPLKANFATVCTAATAAQRTTFAATYIIVLKQ